MSSPRAEYEEQRAQLLKELGQIAPQPLIDRFNQLIRPAITLQSNRYEDLDEEEREHLDFKLLTSKLGGTPDIPVGFNLPHCEGEPLDFVAQINLAEMAAFDLEGLLPKSGALSFWINVDMTINEKWGACRVFLIFNEKLQKPKGLPDGLQEFSLTQLKPQIWASVPNVEGNIEFYDDNGIEDNALSSALSDYIFYRGNCNSGHQILGFPENIQYDVRAEASTAWNTFLQSKQAHTLGLSEQQDVTQWSDWELLLQIGEDNNANMTWGDAGTIYFLIRRNDLKEKRFDRCWGIFQCG